MSLDAVSICSIVSASRWSVTSSSFSACSSNFLDLKQHSQSYSTGSDAATAVQAHFGGLVYTVCTLVCVAVMSSDEFFTLTVQQASVSSVSLLSVMPRDSFVSAIHWAFSVSSVNSTEHYSSLIFTNCLTWHNAKSEGFSAIPKNFKKSDY